MIAERPDTILHLGAGRCSELSAHEASGAGRIILVDADPEMVRYLRNRTSGLGGAEVLEMAVSGPGDSRVFRIFNARGYSSLAEPTGLFKLYPGLRTTAEFTVDTHTLPELVADLRLSSDESNHLIIDVPGEEWEVVQALDNCADVFDRVTAFCPASPLYEGDQPADAVLSRLVELGYERVSQDAQSDPERPVCTLVRDPIKVANAELQEQLEASQGRVGELEAHVEELEQQQESAAAEAKKRVAELTAERDEHAKQAKEQAAQVESLRRQELKQLESEVTRRKTREFDHLTVINRLRARVCELEDEDEKLRATQTALHEELRKAEGQLELVERLLRREYPS